MSQVQFPPRIPISDNHFAHESSRTCVEHFVISFTIYFHLPHLRLYPAEPQAGCAVDVVCVDVPGLVEDCPDSD